MLKKIIKYLIKLCIKCWYFFREVFLFLYNVCKYSYKQIIADYKRVKVTYNWIEDFFYRRFVHKFKYKQKFRKLVALSTFLGFFTLYPWLLFLLFFQHLVSGFTRYFFLPFDILFINHIFKYEKSFSIGLLLTFKSIYNGLSNIKSNLNTVTHNIFLFRTYFTDFIYWANRVINVLNTIDLYLFNFAIWIELYIYFLISGFYTGVRFYYWLEFAFRYYFFSRSGRMYIRLKIKFTYRHNKFYFKKFCSYIIFFIKSKMSIYKRYFLLSISNIYLYSIWGLLWLIWELIWSVFIGLSLIIRSFLLIYYKLKVYFNDRKIKRLGKRLEIINEKILDEDKLKKGGKDLF